MLNSTRFIEIYNLIDNYMRETLDEDKYPSHSQLIDRMAESGDPVFEEHRVTLREFAELRNSIVHNNTIDGQAIAEPHDQVLELYERIYEDVSRPELAIDAMAISYHSLYKGTLSSRTKDIIDTMAKKGFDQVPVVDDEGRLIGVFSENTLVSYISDIKFDKEGVGLIELKRLADLSRYIPIRNHTNEFYIFVKESANVYEIKKLYKEDHFKGNKKLAGIFITKTGKESEKILGFITPWDVVKY